MKHHKSPVMLLRKRADEAAARIAVLELELLRERRFSGALLKKNEERINAESTRMQRERNSK